MKQLLTSVLLLSSLVTAAAFAETEAELEAQHRSRCENGLKLSDSQKLELKELSEASTVKLHQLGLEIKKAKLEAELVLTEVETSKEAAVLATEALTEKLNEVQAVKQAEKLAVLFDVLTPEQRLKKLKCESSERGPSRFGHRRPVHRPGSRVTPRPLPYRPGRIEHAPRPNYRPGRVVTSPYRSSRRGGMVHPVIIR